jgi:hypothetical protein
MIGLGVLLRILRGLIGKPLEKTGVLPTRYYLGQVLTSLDQDDIGDAIRQLRLSKGALVDQSRWELVRQHVLFRCRVMMESHEKRIRVLEDRIRKLRSATGPLRRWRRKAPSDKLPQYEKVLGLERHAKALLETYERELKQMSLAKGHRSSVSVKRSPVTPQS